MRKATKIQTYIYVISLLSLLLLIASIFTHQQEDFDSYRAIRGIVSFSAVAVLLVFAKKHLPVLLSGYLLFYGASSITTIWYENNQMATLAMTLNLIAYLFIICALWPKVSFKKMSKWLLLVFILMVLLNGFILYEFITMLRSFAMSNMHYLFMLLGAMSTVVVGFLALLYNYQHSSRASLLFCISIFIIIFSEVFRAIAYYDFAFGNIAVYTSRILLILGTFLLVHFTQIKKASEEELH